MANIPHISANEQHLAFDLAGVLPSFVNTS